MANPLTANTINIPTHIVTKLVSDITNNLGLCEITLLARGAYGFIFRIRIPDVPDGPDGLKTFNDYPFKTFTINPNGDIIFTSQSPVSSQYFNTFCCKLVPILDGEVSPQITIKVAEHPPIQQHTSTSLSFNNECHKQRHMYALTNRYLNSVCLPLFYFDIVNLSRETILKEFIESVFVTTGITVTHPLGLHYGISFMPFSPNTYETSPIQQNTTIHTFFSTPSGITRLQDIIYSLQSFDDRKTALLTRHIVKRIFMENKDLYTFISVISLIIRLYCVGYCHGDLHSGNIVVYPEFPSSMSLDPIDYFMPTFSLIDTGFAYRHGQEVPPDILKNYESFKRVIRNIITNKTKKTNLNMREFTYHTWFSIIFEDSPEFSTSVKLNKLISTTIFRLFQFYERYRVNFERRQLGYFIQKKPGQIEIIREENRVISESVDEYITSLGIEDQLDLFNRYGGRRHLHSYDFTRNKSKKIIRNKMNHRKSQKRRRSHRKSTRRRRRK
jgi:hypothetical protein